MGTSTLTVLNQRLCPCWLMLYSLWTLTLCHLSDLSVTWVCLCRLQHLRLSLRSGPVSPDTGGPCHTSWKFPPPLLLVLSSVTGQVLSPMLALLQLQPATRFDTLFCPFSTQPMACRPAPRTTPLPCPVSGPADRSVPMPCLLVSQPPELSSMFPYSDA